MNDRNSYNISISAAAGATKELENDIVRFDRKLERFQQFVTDDLKVYDAIVSARDYLFRLQQLLHGADIVRFCEEGGGASW